MTFLNWGILAGLGAVAIPILIHLLNRRRAKVVDWGAMRFLLASLASRNRRILFEEVVLMALRCLAVALVALAMARPFLPSRSIVPWAVILPAVLVAAMALGIATVTWAHRWVRWSLLALGGLLLVGAGALTAWEYVTQGRRWSATGNEKDIAIVLDGSMSMTLTVDGKTNFQRAIEEATSVVGACRPADGVGLILAGGVSRAVLPAPTANRQEIALELERLRPAGGDMDVLGALNEAARTLAKGNNPAKKIVFITDGQSVGWDVRSEGRWRFLASALRDLDAKAAPSASAARPQTEIVCRTLNLPKSFKNVAVADLMLSRKVVGADRSVGIDVKVLNTGGATMDPADVELSVDGVKVATERIGELRPNAAETATFSHRFELPGTHVVTARVRSEDDLPGDDASSRVVHVIRRLDILIVEGAPSVRPLDGAASFMEIALAPREDAPRPDKTPKPAPKAPPRPTGYDPDFLVRPKVIEVTEVASVKDLRPYSVVILANVSRLPRAFAESLAAYVRKGGGLLIAPGGRARGDFYNRWHSGTGEPLSPAMLPKSRSAPAVPARLALKTFSHPALEMVADVDRGDADAAMISAFWKLSPDENDPSVRVGGRLDTGDPVLVERKLGKGYVLMTAMSLDRKDSNMPALKCYVPLVHEMVCFLAAASIVESNIRPGAEVTLALPEGPDGQKRPIQGLTKGDPVEVVTPSGGQAVGTVTGLGEALRLRVSEAHAPGVYEVVLPRPGKTPGAKVPGPGGGTPRAESTLRFVVLGNPRESHLATLSEADLASVHKHVKLFRAYTTDEMTAAAAGKVPGQELWKYLVACAVLALLSEIALTRWIATQRRSHDLQPVRFADAVADVEALRSRAEEILTVPAQPEEVASET